MPKTSAKPPVASLSAARSRLLQRSCACGGSSGSGDKCEECQQKEIGLQRLAAAPARSNVVPPIVHEVLRSPGQPLDSATRAFMEPRFGHDFRNVRLHTNDTAQRSAESVGALAYTVGRNVAFAPERYSPTTESGRRLLAHELSHVIQQGGGDAPPTSIGAVDDATEREADQASEAIVSNKTAIIGSHDVETGIVQRELKSADPFPSGSEGHPPQDMAGCHVILGGRLIDDPIAGPLGFRHLYLDTYLSPTDYALIEGGPVGSSTTGKSGAWVKPGNWGVRGIQWDLTPQADCPSFVSCLRTNTSAYNAAGYPYHYSRGPNSNSFAWWLLHQCGQDISTLFSGWLYIGIDYWKTASSSGGTAAAPPTK